MSAAEGSKPTPGPWSTKKNGFNECAVVAGNGVWITYVAGEHQKSSTQEANARLIAEAGTVHHETGKTPRQLQDALSVLEQERSVLADEVERLTRERADMAIVPRKITPAIESAFLRWARMCCDDPAVFWEAMVNAALTEQQP